MGETEVRDRVSAGPPGLWNIRKLGIAQGWLAEQAQLREDEKHRENIDVAKSATIAAQISAVCAVLAALAAIGSFFL